jgi:hypothetical protein
MGTVLFVLTGFTPGTVIDLNAFCLKHDWWSTFLIRSNVTYHTAHKKDGSLSGLMFM